MDFGDYQYEARRTQNKALPLWATREHALYGLASEVGEVLNNVDEKITMSLTSEEAIREVYDTMKLEIVFKGLPGERIEEVG